MEDISEAEKQRRQKYEHHDFSLEDLKPMDIDMIKDIALKDFVSTRESSAPKLIIASFMGYLKNNGFRITKVKK